MTPTGRYQLRATPCPCGCKKLIVEPLFGCQCSSLRPEDAAELVSRYNSQPELLALVERAVGVLQRHILPEGGPSDHDAMSELYGIFDGPEYRAAMATIGGKS